MESSIPRLLLAGTHSGCGKTTVTCGILQALVNRGLAVGAFKCGPDYIDPMFHSRIIGAKSGNLDPYFFSPNTLRYLLAKNAAGRQVSILEGVMGYYDGLGDTPRASSWEVARITETPAVLVLSARGASLSILAAAEGFLNFLPDSQIHGVILNQCPPSLYPQLAGAIRQRFGGRLRPLGFLPPVPEAVLESRHLGLITAEEVTDLRQKLAKLAEKAEECIDLAGLLDLARSAPPLRWEEVALPRFSEPVRIGVARDKAFCFYYEDSLSALEELGAELVPFSPLEDSALPPDLQGLYLGGGYPELYAKTLSENRSMKESIRAALSRGLPCIAECGGFMYLTEAIGDYPMVGFLPGKSFDAGRLTRFGYLRLRAETDNLLCLAGEEIPGHEFHRWDSQQTGSGFTARKENGRSWPCVFATPRLYAGYPHFHFYANPDFAVRFYQTCLEEKHRHDPVSETHGDRAAQL